VIQPLDYVIHDDNGRKNDWNNKESSRSFPKHGTSTMKKTPDQK
jgi:hypothetical protein